MINPPGSPVMFWPWLDHSKASGRTAIRARTGFISMYRMQARK
ncbi:MAG TPA: hypothetical protein VLT60_08440 [Usitatibacter sp.]|nr:hypothetical protein [Usitatibacter sp.]